MKKFVGRGPELDKISSFFEHNRDHTDSTMVLCAMGGQGKSQIALKYCKQSRKKYRGIFWVVAATLDTAVRSYEAIAKELKEPSWSAKDPKNTIDTVKAELETWEDRWLLVFDNYDRPDLFEDVGDLFPSSK